MGHQIVLKTSATSLHSYHPRPTQKNQCRTQPCAVRIGDSGELVDAASRLVGRLKGNGMVRMGWSMLKLWKKTLLTVDGKKFAPEAVPTTRQNFVHWSDVADVSSSCETTSSSGVWASPDSVTITWRSRWPARFHWTSCSIAWTDLNGHDSGVSCCCCCCCVFECTFN